MQIMVEQLKHYSLVTVGICDAEILQTKLYNSPILKIEPNS